MKHTPLLIVTFLLACVLATSAVEARQPNIIVIYTDDHGHADLGIHGLEKDLRTPHLDALARSGVVARQGYSTAPQCVPSRGGLMTGKFQGRFGLDNNNSSLDGFDQQTIIATRLQNAGYIRRSLANGISAPRPRSRSTASSTSSRSMDGRSFPRTSRPAARTVR